MASSEATNEAPVISMNDGSGSRSPSEGKPALDTNNSAPRSPSGQLAVDGPGSRSPSTGKPSLDATSNGSRSPSGGKPAIGSSGSRSPLAEKPTIDKGGSISPSGTKTAVDPYGFERPENFDYDTYEDFMASYMTVLARRAGKWDQIVRENETVSRSGKLKRYVRKGIPSEHRPMMWMFASGAEQRMKENPGLYQSLLKAEHDPHMVDCIEKDVPRTFPENIYFQNTPSDPNGKRKPLHNVLLALAQKNPNVGYCQGLNFICGILLLIVKEEEKAFWLMDVIVSDMVPEYYTSDMLGIKVDQEVLGELVKLKVPEVQAMFVREGVAWPLISSKWFLCIYADVLPIETVLRIWDSFFYEGTKILFRVAVTMVKMNKKKLMECKNFADIINVAKSLPQDASLIKCHDFMERIFKEPGSFPMSTIIKFRRHHRDLFLKEAQ